MTDILSMVIAALAGVGIMAALSIAILGVACVNNIGKYPEHKGSLMTLTVVSMGMVESIVLYVLVIFFTLYYGG